MAYQNKTIRNPKTGQDIRFLQTTKDTGGKLLEMEATYRPHSIVPAEHYHPYQDEEFQVLQGELTVRLEGSIKIIKAGEKLHIDRNVPHAMWNGSGAETMVRWKVIPAMQTEYLLETMTGLACDNKTNNRGMPSFLQTVAIAKRFSDVLRLTKPPYAVQKISFAILSLFARLSGYQSFYKKYID